EYNYRQNYFQYSHVDVAGQEAVLTFADEIAFGAEFGHTDMVNQEGMKI
ncbi:MAG: hypothetical protein GTO02_01600, partial [Candidatus Dadabacteria bacterium]|nr:hypothetical protein [Candidatus Dadabacteria bacterium]